MRFDVLTLFPGVFAGFLGQALLQKAIRAGLVQVELHDLRDWAGNKHDRVDDRPFGGGPGMILRVEPVVHAVEEIQLRHEPARIVLLTPQGRTFDQRAAESLARERRLVLVCGRYEGFDERVIDILQPDQISIGDYVLNGGEVPAMVVIESVMRLVPGVLGDERSAQNDSFSLHVGAELEGAQYTRPREFRGRCVPDVLLSGNHEAIAAWRTAQSRERTQRQRS